VGEGKSEQVIQRLPKEIAAAGGKLTDLRIIPPALEDVFIALSESNHD